MQKVRASQQRKVEQETSNLMQSREHIRERERLRSFRKRDKAPAEQRKAEYGRIVAFLASKTDLDREAELVRRAARRKAFEDQERDAGLFRVSNFRSRLNLIQRDIERIRRQSERLLFQLNENEYLEFGKMIITCDSCGVQHFLAGFIN